jgi:hypothetical protein
MLAKGVYRGRRVPTIRIARHAAFSFEGTSGAPVISFTSKHAADQVVHCGNPKNDSGEEYRVSGAAASISRTSPAADTRVDSA